MDISNIQPEWKVEKIEVATLTGERARSAGSNGRLGDHGKTVRFVSPELRLMVRRALGTRVHCPRNWQKPLLA